jgi:putative membrane protein
MKVCGVGAVLLAMAPMAFGHSSVPLGGESDTVAELVAAGVPMLCAGILYAAGQIRLSGRNASSGLRAMAFWSGLVTLALALFSPLDRWSAELFSAHMVQHEVLMLIAAPLLVLGRPLPLFLWAFPQAPRSSIAAWFQRPRLKTTWRVLHAAGAAWVLHALALWVWHIPPLFDAVLENRFIHDLQHVTFIGTALLFWSALFSERRSAQRGAGIVYLFTTTIHTSILGALITFASHPWYSSYLNTPAAWGLTALEDQQLGGLIMWVPGSLVYVGVALYLLARWIVASEQSVARHPASKDY